MMKVFSLPEVGKEQQLVELQMIDYDSCPSAIATNGVDKIAFGT
jgi:hypothetical protein